MFFCDIFNEIDFICIHMYKIWVNLDWYNKGEFGFGQHEFNGRLTCCLQINVHSLFSFLISWEHYDPNNKVYFWNFPISYCENDFHFIILSFCSFSFSSVFQNSFQTFFSYHGGKLISLPSILEELNFVVVGALSIRCLIYWRKCSKNIKHFSRCQVLYTWGDLVRIFKNSQVAFVVLLDLILNYSLVGRV